MKQEVNDMDFSQIRGPLKAAKTSSVVRRSVDAEQGTKDKASGPNMVPTEQVEIQACPEEKVAKTLPNSSALPTSETASKKPTAQSFRDEPLLQETESADGTPLHDDAIDGFLKKMMTDTPLPKIPREDMLVTEDTKFPSLEHGTRHRISRTERPSCYPDRGSVPDDWGTDYEPTPYTAPVVESQPVWAENTDFQAALRERAQAAGLDSTNLSDKEIAKLYPSYEGSQIVDGQPRNPRGPTGITGQGLLGDHGENTAADPIVFRRHRDPETGQTKLQMIAIQRKDNGKWAIPGGMTDYGEAVSGTLARELREEALGEGVSDEKARQFDVSLKEMFDHKGTLVYQGAVDDERNTDTSWMATKVVHVEMTGDDAAAMGWDMKLTAGDDAKEAKWMDVTAENLSTLNANHGDFVGKSVQSWQAQNGLAVRKDGVIGES